VHWCFISHRVEVLVACGVDVRAAVQTVEVGGGHYMSKAALCLPCRTEITLSHYMPDRPFGLQEAEAQRICRQSAHEGGKVVSPTHRPPLPPGGIPGVHLR
jgi:hypothetical protein